MKKNIFLLLIIVLFITKSAFALTGRQIIEKSEALPQPNSSKTMVHMTILKNSRTLIKEFTTIHKKINGLSKQVVTFIKPTRIKLLTHEHNGRDDDQWLRLSSGRIKRIASGDKDKPFVNSHFSYDDLQSREIDDYKYKYIGKGKAAGIRCHKVEAIKNKGKKKYDKSILYISSETATRWTVIRADFFNNNKLIKSLENSKFKTISGIITPFEIKMTQMKEYTLLKPVSYTHLRAHET